MIIKIMMVIIIIITMITIIITSITTTMIKLKSPRASGNARALRQNGGKRLLSPKSLTVIISLVQIAIFLSQRFFP